jgi:nickel/cobalt transporter (NicO) family protein
LEPSSLSWLAGLAAAIAFTHTLLGPDHYLPLAVTARAGRWSFAKTMAVVALCGTGHVLSSLLLGVVGIVAGISLARLEGIESWRGDAAAWTLLAFGLCYTAWGLRRAARRHEHSHVHAHADGTIHAHRHSHRDDHLHAHPTTGRPEKDVSSWMLFSIFLLGPCEPLIPILMFPAARGGLTHALVVAAVFGVVTLVTMLAATAVAWLGMARFEPRLPRLERWSHGIAGSLISLSAIGVLFLGL